ncbi:MAG: peptidase M23 [Fibrobacter sp.]|nr:peptidase M23 [Fibrobacter sp.]
MLLALAIFLFFYLGGFTALLERLPMPGEDKNAPVEKNWRDLCLEAKGTPFALKGELVQCSWVVKDSMPLLPSSFLRYVASERRSPLAKLHWVSHAANFGTPLLVQREDVETKTYLNILLEDSSSVWIDMDTGCRFPGLCPQTPLNFSSLPITEDFDFDGQESLLAADVLRGIGEAPVHPVLPGRILNEGRDSLGYFIEIDHGNNITSRMWGMLAFVDVNFSSTDTSAAMHARDSVNLNSVVGRLAPVDSATFFLRIRRNGAFVRWDDFYKETHPLDSAKIAKFKEEVGL